MSHTAEEKAKEARREALTRERVYPGWIRLKRISADTAARRIAIMTEIAEDYLEQAKREQLL